MNAAQTFALVDLERPPARAWVKRYVNFTRLTGIGESGSTLLQVSLACVELASQAASPQELSDRLLDLAILHTGSERGAIVGLHEAHRRPVILAGREGPHGETGKLTFDRSMLDH